MTLAQEVACPLCKRPQKLTLAGKFRVHGPKDDPCDMSGCFLPAEMLKPLPPTSPPKDDAPCPQPPTTSPSLSDAAVPAASVTSTSDSTSDTTPTTDTPSTTSRSYPTPALAIDSRTQLKRESGYDRPDPVVVGYEQPDNKFKPMDTKGAEIAVMVKEMFYQYTNRSRRSQQKTLGPSEIGTPCDRRLVMRLLGAPRINPGGDNWASWVGTQIHTGLEGMFKWADAGQGRFATEQRLSFPSELVPRGTLDLLDRVLFMVDDHKAMGEWSLNSLRTKGPSSVYRTQLHVYAMGARQRGEKVERVGLIAWPRDKSNLDELYVWTEPYDPQIARDALARVDGLKALADKMTADGSSPREIAEAASIQDDCRYCPFHMKDATDLSNGACNGRR